VSPITVGSIVFVCTFGGSLLGLVLQSHLPEEHLRENTRNVVMLGMGLVGTMAALILGLLVASARASYDAQSAELTQLSSNVVMLDRVLAHYGPETTEAREMLKNVVASILNRMRSKDRRGRSLLEPSSANEPLFEKIQALSSKNDSQRSLQSQALGMFMSLGQARWLMYEQGANSVPDAFVIALGFWLTVIFVSWGLFAPTNGTVIAGFLIAALSVSAALFLTLEMYNPYGGLIQIPIAPVQVALAHLGN
jgi:hypothetical protein